MNDTARVGREHGRHYTELHLFNREISSLLDRAQELCPVMFVGMVPVLEAQMLFMDCLYYNHADRHRYKEVTRLACAEGQIPYLDIFYLWMERGQTWRRSRLSADGLHPNVAGYQALLEDVLNWEPISKLTSLGPTLEADTWRYAIKKTA